MNATPSVTVAESGSRTTAPFSLTQYLEGTTSAVGIFEDRFGRLRMRFTVEMTGTWRAETFELDESFCYETGEIDKRKWLVHPGTDNNFRAVCPDAASDAIGRNLPGMVEMTYRFRLPLAGRHLTFDFLDRLYDMGEGRAINRVRISKYAVAIGELTLFLRKQ